MGVTQKVWLSRLAALGLGSVLALKVLGALKRQRPFKRLSVSRRETPLTPTVLVHGTNGTRRSLGGMIDRWDKSGLGYKALELEVAKDGQIKLTGNWHGSITHKQPLVQVIFKMGDPPEWQQGEWLKQVLALLKKKLGIHTVNIVGHSMGGVAGLRYIVDHGAKEQLPKVNKLVTIGAPFNGEVVAINGKTVYDLGRRGPLRYHETYRYFSAYQKELPANLNILNIYGDLGNGSRSDGIVSIDSVKALRFLVEKSVKSYQEQAITGVQGQHSLLHENKQVDQLVANYLWQH